MARIALEYKNEEKKINEINNEYGEKLGLNEDEIPQLNFESDKVSENQKKKQIEMHFLDIFQKLEKLKKSEEQKKELREIKDKKRKIEKIIKRYRYGIGLLIILNILLIFIKIFKSK
jgi:hypothetical protein